MANGPLFDLLRTSGAPIERGTQALLAPQAQALSGLQQALAQTAQTQAADQRSQAALQQRREAQQASAQQAQAGNEQKFLGATAASLANVPQEQRPAAIQTALQTARQQGFDIDAQDEAAFQRLVDPRISSQVASQFGPKGGQQVNVSLPALAKETPKADVAEITRSIENAEKSERSADLFRELKQILPEIGQTGLQGQVSLQVNRLREVLGLPNTAGPQQLFDALSNQAALTKSELISGALSEGELAVLQKTVPGLDKTPEANARIIDANIAVGERARALAEFKREYLKNNGDLSGANRQFKRFARDNKIVKEVNGDVITNRENIDNYQQYLDPSFKGKPKEQREAENKPARLRFNPATGGLE